MSLRVATLNLWGRSGAWADRRQVLVDGVWASDHFGVVADLEVP